MVRLFNVYYPVRRVVLFGCEAAIVSASFVVATMMRLGADSYIALNYDGGFSKILLVTFIALLVSYYLDLYGPSYSNSRGETVFRLLVVLGLLSFFLAITSYLFPGFIIGQEVFLYGLVILTVSLLLWRGVYDWLMRRPFLQERVYVIGSGPRADTLVSALRARADLAIDVVGWAGAGGHSLTREALAEQLQSLGTRVPVERVLLALSDRRGVLPVRELLNLRLRGVKVEEATALLERVDGKIEVDDLYPSSLIFSDGFRLNSTMLLARRILSIVMSATGLILCLPLIPIIALAVKLSSPGPVFFRQERVGRGGGLFKVVKFRTMRQDAEATTGAVWAGKDDPRITKVGRFLRKTRLDEIPQLWNVLRGDMAFVGPRPERPEFVQWLNEKIPYYNLRHMIRPGLTGWAQVRYQYGASLEETKQKLQYDLYYIKHMSVALDLFIMFETVKTVLLRRGAQ